MFSYEFCKVLKNTFLRTAASESVRLFRTCKAEQPLRGMELQEKESQKN